MCIKTVKRDTDGRSPYLNLFPQGRFQAGQPQIVAIFWAPPGLGLASGKEATPEATDLFSNGNAF